MLGSLGHVISSIFKLTSGQEGRKMFHICQGSCFCVSGEGVAKGKVVYCFGEVRYISKKDNKRGLKKLQNKEHQQSERNIN